ncbi:unnamed protein product [Closterium sp. Naga37s-1]|nr:unnamed protein product [Closterium sp. Naga37s-1]
MRNRVVRKLSGLSGISESDLWIAPVVLLLACAARGAFGCDANEPAVMHGNGNSRSHAIPHGNGSNRHIVMRGDGSMGHRRQLQLVGQVKTFEAELQYYVPVPIRTHRERANLLIEPLGFAFNSSNQQRVMLHYLEHDPKWGILAQCRGDTCILLSRAAGARAASGVQLGLFTTSTTSLFENMPLFVVASNYPLQRTHPTPLPSKQVSYSAEQQVHVLPAAFSWAYSQGNNFYHFIVETMPLFLVAAPLLPRILPSIPILAEDMQWDAYKRFGEVLIGVKYGAMRSLPLVKADLFFVHTLYEVSVCQLLLLLPLVCEGIREAIATPRV